MSPGPPSPRPPALLGAIHAHVGIVTADLAEGKRALGTLFGLEWGDDFDGALAPPFCDGAGTATPGLVATNTSTGNPIRVEVLQGRPGSVWATSHRCRLHHVAYQVEDFDGCVASLLDEGWRVEVTLDVGTSAPATGFAYLVKHGETRMEITTG